MISKIANKYFLRGSEESNKVMVGASYLLGERIFKLVVGLLVHSLMARYLSPISFGKMGFIINFATAFLPVTLFGLEDIGVRKMVHFKGKESEITSEIITVRFFAFLLVTFFAALFLIFFRPEEGFEFIFMTWIFCTIYNFTGCFFSLELPFLSKVSNRPIFISRIMGYVLGTGLKFVGIFNGLSFKFILSTYLIEELVGKIILAKNYFKHYRFKPKMLLRHDLIEYVRPSFWIVSGSFLMIIENKIGFLVIEKLSGAKELGFFTAAFMLVDLWVFIPLAIMSAVLPTLVTFHKENNPDYAKRLQELHGLFFIIQAGFVVSVWLVAPFLIQILYGEAYTGAEYFLRWQSFTVFLSFIQILRLRWFLIEGKVKIWALMNGAQLIITATLVYGLGFGKDISGIVLCSVASYLVVNTVFSLQSVLVRTAFVDQILSSKYAIRLLKII